MSATDTIRWHYNKKLFVYKHLSVRFLDRYNNQETMVRVKTQRYMRVTFRTLTLLVNALLLSTFMGGWAFAQDLRIVRTVDPYAQGVAVDSLRMGRSGTWHSYSQWIGARIYSMQSNLRPALESVSPTLN